MTRRALREAWVCATILLAGLFVADAASAQRVWDPPVTLSAADQDAGQPALAMDGRGYAIATWIRQQGSGPTTRTTQAARMAVTGFWGRAQNLYTPPASAAAPFEASDVALNAGGRGVAIWIRAVGNTSADQMVQAASFSGAGWGAPANLMPVVGSGIASPRVGIDNHDRSVAVWVQQLGGISVVRESRRGPSGAWSGPTSVSSPTEAVADGVELAVDAAGNAIAVWVAPFGGVPTLREARFLVSTGTWSPATSIGPAGRSPFAVRLALNRAGTAAFVAFRGFNSANDVVRAARLDSIGGLWSTPVDVSLPGQDVFDLDVAVDEAGRAVAVWSRFDGIRRTIQTARHSGAWSPPSNRTTGVDTGEARIASDAAGNAVAVWTTGASPNHRVQSSSFSVATNTWTPVANVSTQGDAAAPRVRLHTDGAAVVVWQSNGDFFTIQSSRYVLETAPILQAPTVTDNTVSIAWSPGAGPAPAGYTVVAAREPGGTPMAWISAGTQTSLTVTAQPGAFYVRVEAAVAGQLVSSNEVEVVVGPGAAPTAPQALAVAVTGSVLTFTWAPPSNAPPVTVLTYYIEAGSMEGSSNLAFFPTGNTQTTYVTPPVPNGSYWLRVRAQSAGGLSPPSDEVRIVIGPPPPDAPVLSGGATGPGAVLLQWTAPAAPGAPVTGYQLRAGSRPGSSDVGVLDFPASTLAFGSGGIPSGIYYVRVVALSSQGPSEASNELVVTVP